jgi:cyclase
MLKVRVMPTLLYKAPTLVKGIGFDSWRRVGSLMQAIKVYSMRQVDELVFLDISATAEGRPPDLELVDDFADECFMPLTVGGGIRTISDVRNLLRVGADKVAINSAAVETPSLIGEIAAEFGSQCIVVSIDVKRSGDGSYSVWTYSGKKPTGLDPVVLARESEKLGAGEIILTSIDRDGTMSGYDVELTKRVSEAIKIPLIASGGAGCYAHIYEVIVQGGASAIAAASIFHFTQQTPLEVKRFLKERGIAIRV